MRWYTIPKGTPGKLLKLTDSSQMPLTKHVLREEVGTDELFFDPVSFENGREMPSWARGYAQIGYCGVAKKNDKGETYVFITPYRNVGVA